MASDILYYEGRINSLVIKVTFVDYKDPEFMGRPMVYRDEQEINIGHKNLRKLAKLVTAGRVSLEYKGGFCSNGDYWNANDVGGNAFDNYHDEGGD